MDLNKSWSGNTPGVAFSDGTSLRMFLTGLAVGPTKKGLGGANRYCKRIITGCDKRVPSITES